MDAGDENIEIYFVTVAIERGHDTRRYLIIIIAQLYEKLINHSFIFLALILLILSSRRLA